MSKEEEEAHPLSASFPNASNATDKAILQFGALFVKDYARKLEDELEQYKLAIELQSTLQGLAETPQAQRMGLGLRQDLIKTLHRLSTIIERLSHGAKD